MENIVVAAGELIKIVKPDNTTKFITWNIEDDNIYFYFYFEDMADLNPVNFRLVFLPLGCKSWFDQENILRILIIPSAAYSQDSFQISYCYDSKVDGLVFYLVSDIESIKNTTSHPDADLNIVFDTRCDLNSQQEKIVLFEII